MPTHFVEGQEFWPKYYALPEKIRDRADRRYELLEIQPDHHRLAFEKRCDTEGGGLYKADVDRQHRALALEVETDVYLWFWIGKHDEYERKLDLLC
jgi:hypothetical protein